MTDLISVAMSNIPTSFLSCRKKSKAESDRSAYGIVDLSLSNRQELANQLGGCSLEEKISIPSVGAVITKAPVKFSLHASSNRLENQKPLLNTPL